MTLREKLLTIEKRFSWSLYGVILAVVFGAIAIFGTFFYNNDPKIKYELLHNLL